MSSPLPLAPDLLPAHLLSQLDSLAAARGLDLHRAFQLAVAEGLARLEAMPADERQQAAASLASGE